MQLIKLTSCTSTASSPVRIFLNPKSIDGIIAKSSYSVIYANNERFYEVQESPEQIFEMIGEVLEEETLFIHEGVHANQSKVTAYNNNRSE